MKLPIGIPVLVIVGVLNAAAAENLRVPVIVELFTSEGCSSCPSADNLLSRLDKTQPVANARIIALEEHVDYWNQLGWTDPFSSAQFSQRQNEYSQALRIDSVYTPQVVVNGKSEFVGGDGKKSIQEVTNAAALSPAYVLRVEQANGRLAITVKKNRDGKTEPADVMLAITEGRLSSNVRRGENSGRLLQHAPVVRSLGVIGSIQKSSGDQLEFNPRLNMQKAWNRENLRAVVFIQDRASRRITAAADIDLP